MNTRETTARCAHSSHTGSKVSVPPRLHHATTTAAFSHGVQCNHCTRPFMHHHVRPRRHYGVQLRHRRRAQPLTTPRAATTAAWHVNRTKLPGLRQLIWDRSGAVLNYLPRTGLTYSSLRGSPNYCSPRVCLAVQYCTLFMCASFNKCDGT